MAAGAWTLYNQTKEWIGEGEIDFSTDSFLINLYLDTSNVGSAAFGGVDPILASATNQVASAFGYTQNNETITATWVRAAGTVTFGSSVNPAWTAAGGSIVCHWAVIWDTTPSAPAPVDPLICYSLLDAVNITCTNTNTLTIDVSGGIFTLT